MFKGFNIKYPEYEVILPQTHMSFNVRSLNVQEEERLKGSLVTPIRITEHLNKCIYDSITKKPESIKDFNTFLQTVTIKDREALLYGLFHITYEEVRNYNVICGKCEREYPVTVQISNIFTFQKYPGNDVLKKRVKTKLPISQGVSAVIRQPTLIDELNAIKGVGAMAASNLDIVTETLVIDSFEQDIVEQAEPVVYSDREDIIDAYLSLAAKDKRAIHEAYLESFGQYGIELKMKSYCTFCGFEEIINIDLVTNFFRNVYSA